MAMSYLTKKFKQAQSYVEFSCLIDITIEDAVKSFYVIFYLERWPGCTVQRVTGVEAKWHVHRLNQLA